MRVNAGFSKGKKLKSLSGKEVRPTSDKVKAAVFDTLGQNLEGKNFLDLFSGTGGMGIEALSRGAEYAVFIEKNTDCVKIIYENLKITGLDSRARVIKTEVFRGLAKLQREKLTFDYIYMDPPYFGPLYVPVMEAVSEKGLFEKDGILIVEHFKNIILPEKVFGLRQGKEKKYGDTIITYYFKKEEVL